jgi:hypothetical protein
MVFRREQNVKKKGSVSVLRRRRRRWEKPTQLGPIERAQNPIKISIFSYEKGKRSILCKLAPVFPLYRLFNDAFNTKTISVLYWK